MSNSRRPSSARAKLALNADIAHDPNFWTVFHQVELESDRGAAIIAAAHVQDSLKVAILSRLPNSDLQRVVDLLNPDGPLGTFSAQITMAYALAIIGKTAFDDLDYIRQIRNRFAHRTLAESHSPMKLKTALTFDNQQIADWCANLAYPRVRPPIDTREIFATHPPDWTKGIKVYDPIPPRMAYVWTCEVASIALLHHAHIKSGKAFDYSL